MLTRRGWQVEGAGGSGTLFVGEVKVDHGRGNIRVPEDVLEGADVGIGIEEMGREAVTEGVAGDAFGDRGLFESFLQLPLHGVLEKVVSGKASGLWMSAELGGGKEEAPGKLQRGIGIFALKGGRKVHGGTIVPEMFQMLLFEFFDVLCEGLSQGAREWDEPVFPPFGIVDLDGVAVEIEVLDPKSHRFADPQSGPIHKLGRQIPGFRQVSEELPDLGVAQDGGGAAVFPRLHRSGNDEVAMLKDRTVEKDEGVESLLLGGRGNVTGEDQVIQEWGDGIGTEIFGRVVLFPEGEVEIAGNPAAVSPFGGDSLVGEAAHLARAIDDVFFDGLVSGLGRTGGMGLSSIHRGALAQEVGVARAGVFGIETESFPIEGISPFSP